MPKTRETTEIRITVGYDSTQDRVLTITRISDTDEGTTNYDTKDMNVGAGLRTDVGVVIDDVLAKLNNNPGARVFTRPLPPA